MPYVAVAQTVSNSMSVDRWRTYRITTNNLNPIDVTKAERSDIWIVPLVFEIEELRLEQIVSQYIRSASFFEIEF